MNKIMTLGVFAHANAGKTTITEQLLVHTKVKKNTGRVDHGNTTTDNMKIEQSRGISVRASMVTIPLNDKTIQLIDTPGHVDFSAEVERAISVLDGAILVVSGVEGIEPQTKVIWNILQEKKVPTIIFINKMDRLGANFDKVLNDLQKKLSSSIIPMVHVEQDQTTKGNIIYSKANHEELLESVAEHDEEIMDKYLENEPVSEEELQNVIKRLSKNGEIQCVFGGSALNNEGMTMLIDALDKYLPTYQETKTNNPSGYVYTIKRDNGVRELYIKVLSGTFKNRQEILEANGDIDKIKTLTKISGSSRVKSDELKAGEIGIVTGPNLKCGDFIGEVPKNFKQISFINPLFQTTLEAQNIEEKIKLVSALEILNDENPDLHAMFNTKTGQIIIKLMGPLQAEIIDNILKERFNIVANFSNPTIVHKEKPLGIGTGYANYTRVSGVGFEVKPLPNGSGIKYSSKVSTDYLFTKYQKQVERLVKQYCQQGLYGWEVTDAEITLIDGKCDNVGSDPSDFNIAIPIALMRAFKDAGMKVLEPNIMYEVTCDKDVYKNVLSLLSNYGVLYDSIEYELPNVKFTGIAPLREIIDLPTFIIKVSSGSASIIEKPNGYVDYPFPKPLEKEYIGPDPRNEEEFLLNMGASFENLDTKGRRK